MICDNNTVMMNKSSLKKKKLINDHPPAKSLQSPVVILSFISGLCSLCNKVKTKTPTTSLCMCAQLCLTLCNHMDCSLGFPRQECWSGLPFPTPGDLPHPGIEPTSLASPTLVGRFITTVPPGKPMTSLILCKSLSG